jgi:RNA polymerase sigma-70 factor (ECF subfamily)
MHDTSELARPRLLANASQPTETELFLQALRERDPAAWTRLFEEHQHIVYRAALAQVGERELAEDVTAQVFLEAIEGIRRYRDRGKPIGAWLMSIARHRSLDALRKRRREARATPPPSPEGAAHVVVALDALERLTTEQRQIMHLRFVEDLSIETVATLTGRSPGAVKSLQHRALRQLRAQLTQAKGTPSNA